MRPSVVNRAALTKMRVRSAQEKPESDAINARTHLGQMPQGTPSGFPVAKLFGEEGRELDTLFAQRLVTHLNAALDNRHRETVAVRLGVDHGRSAYPDPVKATQPLEGAHWQEEQTSGMRN